METNGQACISHRASGTTFPLPASPGAGLPGGGGEARRGIKAQGGTGAGGFPKESQTL